MFGWFKKKKRKLKMYEAHEVVYYQGRKWNVVKGYCFNGSNEQYITLEITTHYPHWLLPYEIKEIVEVVNSQVKPVVRC